MQLPTEYIQQTRLTLGQQLFERYLHSFEEALPVSVRLNPAQAMPDTRFSPVPWCPDGYYLEGRPQFTFDPLLHAGAYYVQEASSMFLDHVLRTALPTLFSDISTTSPPEAAPPLLALDLCAAPGGKSTILASRLPAGSQLISNEPNPKRAQILSENMQKWMLPHALNPKRTAPDVPKFPIVTCNYPQDFSGSKQLFDLILCDVPCSGEGMFRKDPATIGEWSVQNVEKCWKLQRDIVSHAWSCLGEGGLLIYSTCTLNLKENEENIRWMSEELGACPLPIAIHPDWNITGSLLPGFEAPVYRFIPGLTRGEGLFMAALRKPGVFTAQSQKAAASRPKGQEGKHSETAFPRLFGYRKLHVIPNTFLDAMCEADATGSPRVSVSYQQAISYLRHEAITLPADTPRKPAIICFEDYALGLAKNIGNRANNLYPKEWRIKSTHIPQEYEAILRHPE